MEIRNFVPKFLRRSADPTDYTAQQMKEAWGAAMGNSDDLVSVSGSKEALKLSAFFNGIRILSEVPAAMPIDIIQINDEGDRVVLKDHFLKDLISYPNSYQTKYNFFEYLFQCLALMGNAIGVIFSNAQTGAVDHITMVDPRSVTGVRFNNGVLTYSILDKTTGISGNFLADEVIHVRQFAGNGVWGRDVVTYAKDNLGMTLAAERFGNSFYKRKGNHKAVIEAEKTMDDPAWVAFKNRWNSYGDHDTPILEYGMKYKALTIAPDQAQFIASREVGVQDIARWLNLPPHMLKDLSRATFSNIEHQDIQFVKYTLTSILRNVEQELEMKLIFRNNRSRLKIRFNQNAILRGDIKTRAEYYHKMVSLGIMTRNEVRKLESLKAIRTLDGLKGLDIPLEPANITGKKEEKK